jgi:hypothetical protein
MLSEGGVRSSTFRIGEVAGGQKLRLLVFAKYKMLLRIYYNGIVELRILGNVLKGISPLGITGARVTEHPFWSLL